MLTRFTFATLLLLLSALSAPSCAVRLGARHLPNDDAVLEAASAYDEKEALHTTAAPRTASRGLSKEELHDRSARMLKAARPAEACDPRSILTGFRITTGAELPFEAALAGDAKTCTQALLRKIELLLEARTPASQLPASMRDWCIESTASHERESAFFAELCNTCGDWFDAASGLYEPVDYSLSSFVCGADAVCKNFGRLANALAPGM